MCKYIRYLPDMTSQQLLQNYSNFFKPFCKQQFDYILHKQNNRASYHEVIIKLHQVSVYIKSSTDFRLKQNKSCTLHFYKLHLQHCDTE